MRVLLLIGNLVAGGIERQGVHDANALADSGFDVYLGFLKDGRYRELVVSDVRLIDLSSPNYLVVFLRLLRFCRANGIEVILSHHVVLNMLAAVAAKFSGCKCIVNEHGLSRKSRFRHIQMRRISYFFAHEIVAACNATLSLRYEREGLSASRGQVLYNCFRKPMISTSNTRYSLMDTYKLPNNAIILGTVTRMHPVKRVGLFVDLAHRIRKAHDNAYFFILGDGQLKEQIQRKINLLGLQNCVHMLGFHHNIHDYLRQFDIFALTSEIEANSLALIEAMSHGIPCLVFDVGGNNEVIEHNIDGYLIEYPNVEMMANYASSLVVDKILRQSIGRAAMLNAYARFSPEARYSKLKEIITGLKNMNRP